MSYPDIAVSILIFVVAIVQPPSFGAFSTSHASGVPAALWLERAANVHLASWQRAEPRLFDISGAAYVRKILAMPSFVCTLLGEVYAA